MAPDAPLDLFAVLVVDGKNRDRIRAALSRVAPEHALELLPGGQAAALRKPGEMGRLRSLGRDIQGAICAVAGEPCWLVIGTARTPATARREAEEALDVARKLGRAPGAMLHEDLLLESVLSADRRVTERLSSVLTPLSSSSSEARQLLRTVEMFVEHGFSHSATARALGVHRHTVEHRIRRAERALGRPIRPGHDGLLLGLALTASRLSEGRAHVGS